jgi:hypothetical protein
MRQPAALMYFYLSLSPLPDNKQIVRTIFLEREKKKCIKSNSEGTVDG